MADEKRSMGNAAGRSNTPTYPDLPPAYPSIPQAAPNAPPQAATSNAQLLYPPGHIQTSRQQFIALPVTRYDTMTSYTEDCGGVQTIITTGAILDHPIMMQCPFCRTPVTTETKAVSGCLTWVCCAGISIMGFFWGPCCIPFCVARLKDVEHKCPKCHNLVALYKRI